MSTKSQEKVLKNYFTAKHFHNQKLNSKQNATKQILPTTNYRNMHDKNET